MELAMQALRSRPVQFGVALACLSVLQGFVGFVPGGPVVQAVIGCGIAASVVVLRFITKQPISEK